MTRSKMISAGKKRIAALEKQIESAQKNYDKILESNKAVFFEPDRQDGRPPVRGVPSLLEMAELAAMGARGALDDEGAVNTALFWARVATALADAAEAIAQAEAALDKHPD